MCLHVFTCVLVSSLDVPGFPIDSFCRKHVISRWIRVVCVTNRHNAWKIKWFCILVLIFTEAWLLKFDLQMQHDIHELCFTATKFQRVSYV
jgi:hypothetical protein